VRRREKVVLDDADRARILSLSKNLSAVWHAETTTHADRNNMLRMLISEVSVQPVDVPQRATRLRVLWQTGAVSDFTVERKDKYQATATPDEVLELIRAWVDKQDKVIAAELNRRGMPTRTGRQWTISTVRKVRYEYGLYRASPKARRAPDRGPEGLCSLHGVAAAVGVKPAVVRAWVRDGVLEPLRRGGPGHPSWYKLDKATVDRLRAIKSEMDARRAAHR